MTDFSIIRLKLEIIKILTRPICKISNEFDTNELVTPQHCNNNNYNNNNYYGIY